LLEIGKVSVNPFTLSVEIRDVAMSEIDQSTPFVTWERLYVALSPRSLWHRAPVVRELQLERPTVRIERLPEGRFNFSDLLERKKPEPAEPEAEDDPARFSLNNITLHGGRIEIVDRTLPEPVTHRIEDLELSVPFVGNLPYLADRYVQPLVSARVNGDPLELKGELKPFADTQEYTLQFTLAGVDLPRYLGYVPMKLPVEVRAGRLALDLNLSYRTSMTVKPVLELAGRLDLAGLDLRESDGRPLLLLPSLRATLATSRPLERKIHLASLAIDKPQVRLERDAAGVWNVVRLGGGTPASGEKKTAENAERLEGEEASLQLNIGSLRVRDGRLELHDHLPPGGFETSAEAIDISVDGFTLKPKTPFKVALDLATVRKEHLGIDGQVTIQPFALDLAIEARDLPLAAYQPYYRQLTAASIGGTLETHARLRIAPEQPLLLEEARLAIRDLNLPLAGAEGFSLASAELQGGRFDLAANRLEVAEIALDGVDLRFSRAKDGRWSFLDRNYPLLAKFAEPAEAPTPPPQTEEKPFSWRIGRFALREARIAFRDLLPAEPARFDVAGLAVTASDLAAPDALASSFTVEGRFQKNGAFQARGTVVPAGPEVKAALQLRRIPLTSFAPYLGERFRLVLVDGALDARLTANVAKKTAGWRGRVGGDLGVSRFYCLDAAHREDLLRWERLQLSSIDARLEPPALRIAAVTLSDYYAKVLLDEQARLNLAEAFSPPPAEPAAPETTAPETTATETVVPAEPASVPETPAEQAAAPPPEIRIDKIVLQGGKVNFTDRHLPRPFTAEMLQLGGRIEGLTSVPGSRAEVDLRGRLRNESPLTIAGALNPLASPLFLDLKLDFNDIELSPLSPYSGTYVGYLIEKGKLNVTLTYLVENRLLTATNKIFIDQFTFGDAVESERATSLPVRLAVSLLKDRNGEIHLDIPVSGNLDDPQFSVLGIIWQVIKNLLVKAATSPLALISAMAGGEDFSTIVFPYGSAQLATPEQAKLEKVAGVLRDRPELKLEVKGYVDPERDPEGYRRELLQSLIRREKYLDLVKRQRETAPVDAEAVTVPPEEYPEYLWRVYKEADFPKPRTVVGLPKHLPDAELEKLLLANTRVGAEELSALAQARAQAVTAALVEAGSIPRERVFLATVDITEPPADKGASRSRVEFGMAVK
jgi:uncharacterized protein involved in outer membrane biogenesis